VGIPKVQFSFFCDRHHWLIRHKEKKSSFGESLNKYVIISFAHKGYKSRTQDKVYEIKWAVTVTALCSWICKEQFGLKMLDIPVVWFVEIKLPNPSNLPPKCWNPTNHIITKAPKKGGNQRKKKRRSHIQGDKWTT
jgi:hypothetical protein